ncbi:MAG: M28 family peptidase [Nocardioidaceae bacterium]|nr:M28 family peptidase [Nocardioidaceae bacterium]
MRTPRLHVLGAAVVTMAALSACSGETDARRPLPTATSSPVPSASPSPSPTVTPSSAAPVRVDADAAMATVTHLSETIGRRHATSRAYERAADWVEGRFAGLGYTVSRQPVDVPAGNTWGVDVPAGTVDNVVADPPGFDPTRPHAVVGAHLDTIPRAPGAEDNASGVAVLLELARMARAEQPGVPVRMVAFGAEEPRGPSDDDHHYGSQEYVAQLDDAQREALVGMVALDRVGVRGPAVPVCNGGDDDGTRDELVRAARASDTPHTACGDNRSSDHWSFERDGLPGARLGSIPYAGYHSPGDTVEVVSQNQLVRTGTIAWTWMQRLG